jgi:hypothetical protein
VGLITAGTPEAFPSAGGRASEVEASTEGTVAADGTRPPDVGHLLRI